MSQYVFGASNCVHCGQMIEKPKYLCTLCRQPICSVHRSKKSSFGSSTQYFCRPGCPTSTQQQQPSHVASYQAQLGAGIVTSDVYQQYRRPQSASPAAPPPVPQPPQLAVQSQPLGQQAQTQQQQQQQQPQPQQYYPQPQYLFVGYQSPPTADRRGEPSIEVVRAASVSPQTSLFDGNPSGGANYWSSGGVNGSLGGSSPDPRPAERTQPAAHLESFFSPMPASSPGSVPYPPAAAASPSTPMMQTPQTPARSPLTAGGGTSAPQHVLYPAVAPPDECGFREVSVGEHQTLIIRARPAPPAGSPKPDTTMALYADRSKTDHPHNAPLLNAVDKLVQVPGDRRGVILGAYDGNYVWQQRGSRHAAIMPREFATAMQVLKGCRCKHCGAVVPSDEAEAHIATHRRGAQSNTSVDSDDLGTCCGDTQLLRSLVKTKRLGAGAQGEVWMCTTPLNAQLYVVKDIRCRDEGDAIRQYQKSVRLMALDHPHLIQYQCVQRHKHEPIVTVVMEYFKEGDLSGVIRGATTPLVELYVGSLALQLAGALKFMHSRTPPIVHGDIKPENIVQKSNREQVVLMDLDTSKELVGPRREARITEGTTAWMAPEAISKGIETPASDVWSTGLVLYVLAVLPDFPMIDNELLNSEVWSRDHDRFLALVNKNIMVRGYTKEFARLVAAMLSHDPSKRPTPEQLEEMLTEIITAQLISGN